MEQIIYIKKDLALNNLKRLICHKTKQTKQPAYIYIYIYIYISQSILICRIPVCMYVCVWTCVCVCVCVCVCTHNHFSFISFDVCPKSFCPCNCFTIHFRSWPGLNLFNVCKNGRWILTWREKMERDFYTAARSPG